MPSICKFDVAVFGMTQPSPVRLPEYDLRLTPAPTESLSTTDESLIDPSLPPAKIKSKTVTSTSQCYIPSTPNQHFQVTVSNNSEYDACVTLVVDGEWVYSGLSYQPNHKIIYFSGRLIDESTIQEMRFVDLETTCIPHQSQKTLSEDDSVDGIYAREGLGSIVIRIHRVKVIGPWEGKLASSSPKELKPVLVSEKTGVPQAEHRVGFASPSSMKSPVKPQSTEWVDGRNGPPYIEITYYYQSRDKLKEMGLIPSGKVGGKEEHSEFNKAQEGSSSTRKSFWSFWSKS